MCPRASCSCCQWFPLSQAILTTVVTGLVSLIGNAFADKPAPVSNHMPLVDNVAELSLQQAQGSISTELTPLRLLPMETMPVTPSNWMVSDVGSFNSMPCVYNMQKPPGKWYDRMKIPKNDDFQNVKVLGKGKYGEVSAAVLDGRLVALKQLFPSDTSDEDIIWEAEMLWRATNIKAIPNLIGFTLNDIGVEMAMDFVGDSSDCSTVSMLSSLQDDKPQLKYADWLGVLWDVVNGLVELHRINLLHCDIKAGNIMLQFNTMEWRWCGRIVDLGLACQKDPSPPPMHMTPEEQARHLGVCRHLAPEVVRGKTGYTVASDVYAVGTLMCLVDAKIKDNGLKRLGAKCRNALPSKRPSMDHVLARLDQMWEAYF